MQFPVPPLPKKYVLLLLWAALSAAPASAHEPAHELGDVAQLRQAGQYDAALAQANAFLAQHPHDMQMRFFKGLILAEQNQREEAIATYTKLTEDFPELAEPYNNLAVLLAAGGQYAQARSALEAATKINPNYAAAYENLGDIYAKMAIRAYGKSLQVSPSGTNAKLKVTLIHTMIADAGGEISQQLAPAVPAAEAPRIMLASASPAIAPDAAPKPENPPEDAARTAVLQTVENWVAAWNARDVKSYLGFYGNDFQTQEGESRKAWAAKRRTRILDKGYINVTVDAPQVAITDNTATVSFHQVYKSDRFQDEGKKTLLLTRHGDAWRIVQERSSGT